MCANGSLTFMDIKRKKCTSRYLMYTIFFFRRFITHCCLYLKFIKTVDSPTMVFEMLMVTCNIDKVTTAPPWLTTKKTKSKNSVSTTDSGHT